MVIRHSSFVIFFERSLLTAELNNVETLDARFAATVELIRATGGGWKKMMNDE